MDDIQHVQTTQREVRVIELTPTEMAFAATTASIRRESARADGLDTNKHSEISDWHTDFIGALGEQAYAKWKGLYWGGENRTFKLPDVGYVQVRATDYLEGHLIIRPNDTKAERFYFVIVWKNRCRIVGSMETATAKQDKYWRKEKNGWWVPQEDLEPEEE